MVHLISRHSRALNRAPALVNATSGFVAVLLLFAAVGGCSERGFDQSTPDAAIASARQMIDAGKAEQLPVLIYAETPEMRRLYNTAARLLNNVEGLAREINTRFPEETQQLAARAEQQAKEGKPTTLVGQLAQAAQRQRGRRRGPPSPEDRQAFDDAVTRFFSDPYAFIRESDGKLTTTPLGEDMVALLWEGKPILPPLGMVMRRGDSSTESAGTKSDRWYFVLPTSLPGVSDFMPKDPKQFEVMGGLIAVFDRTVVDLRKEIEDGRLTTLDAVSRRAGEMTFLPAVLTFYAYSELRKEKSGGK